MKPIYITVFLVSCSVLVFEISLTRIFSITLWYHFAFMVISIAMLGIGSAGTVLAVCSGNRQGPHNQMSGRDPQVRNMRCFIHSPSNIPLYSLMAGISILVCYIVSNYIPFDPARFSWEQFQLLYLFLYCLILGIPFFFSGILIATVFTFHSDRAMSVYSADLTGAGTGSLLVIVLLNMASPEYAIVTASSLCLAGALFTGNKKTVSAAASFLLLNLFLALYHPDCMNLKISEYKNLSVYLKYPGAQHIKTFNSSYSRIDVFKSPGIRYAPGLSLKYSKPLPDQTGFATDAQRIDVMTDVHDRTKLEFGAFLPASLAFEISRPERALILDPKGGLHVLMAEQYGFQDITKVESDPWFLKVARQEFGEYSGNMYASNTSTGYGRNFLRRSSMSDGVKYNLIDIPMTGVAVSGTFGIAEDYRYTVDAFRQYFDSLEQNGIISASLYIVPPHRTEYRLLATIITAREQNGIPGTASGIAAIRSWDVMTILTKKSPFTADEIRVMKRFSRDKNFDLVYYPGIREDETNRYIKTASNDLVKGFRRILDPASRSSFLDDYLFDIHPVYDRNPFFHYFLKIGNFHAIYETMGHKLLYFINEGYLTPVILGIVFLLSLLIILLPVAVNALRKKNAVSPEPSVHVRQRLTLPALVYFSMLGIGFMFVEVPLIQLSILAIETPSLCVAIILTVLLISSGTGSMFASRFRIFTSPISLLLLSVLISLFTVFQPFLVSEISKHDMYVRVFALLASILPLGFFMGIPFPMGIRLLGRKNEALIPWAWAVNACCSVLAPVLTIMIALIAGFHEVLWLAVFAYVTAFAAMKVLMKSSETGHAGG
jgi:hypothetical protein